MLRLHAVASFERLMNDRAYPGAPSLPTATRSTKHKLAPIVSMQTRSSSAALLLLGLLLFSSMSGPPSFPYLRHRVRQLDHQFQRGREVCRLTRLRSL